MDVHIEDKALAMAAFNGLPSSYEYLIVALDALGSDDKTFSFELVKSRLFQEEHRAEMREKSASKELDTAALFIAHRQIQNSTNESNTPHQNIYNCTACSRNGHSRDRCWGKDINGGRPSPPRGYTPKQNQTRAFQVTHSQSKKPGVEVKSSEVEHVCLTCTQKDLSIPCDARS